VISKFGHKMNKVYLELVYTPCNDCQTLLL